MQNPSESGEVMVLSPQSLTTSCNRRTCCSRDDPVLPCCELAADNTENSCSCIEPAELVAKILDLHAQIARLESLSPSDLVNGLFSRLVSLCLRPCHVDVDVDLSAEVQQMRGSLIELCGRAEGLLERHYAEQIGRLPDPYCQLNQFPYYDNYVKLTREEFKLLCGENSESVRKVAFIGSGPMPLTSIVLGRVHMPGVDIVNYDLDARANELAAGLIAGDNDLCRRMSFRTADIMTVGRAEMGAFDAVFLAALVGLDLPAKSLILHHLASIMRPRALLLVRSAHSARAFLYPVVPPDLLKAAGFHVTSVFHPSDEVVNSVLVGIKSMD